MRSIIRSYSYLDACPRTRIPRAVCLKDPNDGGKTSVSIVKWSGLFYDVRDSGPDERTAASLYRNLNRPPPKASPDGLGLRTTPSRKDNGLPVDLRHVSPTGTISMTDDDYCAARRHWPRLHEPAPWLAWILRWKLEVHNAKTVGNRQSISLRHHGLYTTMREAVLAHHGEADASGAAFRWLPKYDQDSII